MGNIEFAVKALILNGDKFLAVHKSNIQSPNFELPGGRMIFGETAEETVIREAYEETGLHVTPLRLVDTWNYISGDGQSCSISPRPLACRFTLTRGERREKPKKKRMLEYPTRKE